jgi:hypothetical protein
MDVVEPAGAVDATEQDPIARAGRVKARVCDARRGLVWNLAARVSRDVQVR